jgi:hypothetical protein
MLLSLIYASISGHGGLKHTFSSSLHYTSKRDPNLCLWRQQILQLEFWVLGEELKSRFEDFIGNMEYLFCIFVSLSGADDMVVAEWFQTVLTDLYRTTKKLNKHFWTHFLWNLQTLAPSKQFHSALQIGLGLHHTTYIIFRKNQNLQPRKTVLFSNPREDVFCRSETVHDRRTAPIPKLFRRADCRYRCHESEKLSWVRVPVKMLGLRIINFPIIFNDAYQMIRPLVRFRPIKTDKKCKHLSNFPAVTLRELR